MKYKELTAQLLALPEATPQWLTYVLAYPSDGRPIPVGYCLVKERAGAFIVYQGDERGGVWQATADDESTLLVFTSEEAACDWIWNNILWWREFEARRAARRESKGPESKDGA